MVYEMKALMVCFIVAFFFIFITGQSYLHWKMSCLYEKKNIWYIKENLCLERIPLNFKWYLDIFLVVVKSKKVVKKKEGILQSSQRKFMSFKERDIRRQHETLISELERVEIMKSDSEIQIETLQRLSERMLCKICMSNEIQVLLSPCNHAICCENCALPFLKRCPICRTKVKGTIKINFWAISYFGILLDTQQLPLSSFILSTVYTMNEIWFEFF